MSTPTKISDAAQMLAFRLASGDATMADVNEVASQIRNVIATETSAKDAEIERLKAENDELRDRLIKEHLPTEFESWEKVWNNFVNLNKERDALRQEVDREHAKAVELSDKLIDARQEVERLREAIPN